MSAAYAELTKGRKREDGSARLSGLSLHPGELTWFLRAVLVVR